MNKGLISTQSVKALGGTLVCYQHIAGTESVYCADKAEVQVALCDYREHYPLALLTPEANRVLEELDRRAAL